MMHTYGDGQHGPQSRGQSFMSVSFIRPKFTPRAIRVHTFVLRDVFIDTHQSLSLKCRACNMIEATDCYI